MKFPRHLITKSENHWLWFVHPNKPSISCVCSSFRFSPAYDKNENSTEVISYIGFDKYQIFCIKLQKHQLRMRVVAENERHVVVLTHLEQCFRILILVVLLFCQSRKRRLVTCWVCRDRGGIIGILCIAGVLIQMSVVYAIKYFCGPVQAIKWIGIQGFDSSFTICSRYTSNDQNILIKLAADVS